ncbi:MAG: hypothetical protein WBB28_24835 [Crinalium sp.]
MQVFNGTTDNAVAQALSQITWQIRYNLLSGVSPNNKLFDEEIGKGEVEGEFDITAAPMSGSQVTTIQWYRDEQIVRYSIKSISEAI